MSTVILLKQNVLVGQQALIGHDQLKIKKKKPSLTSGKEICDFFKSFKYVNILNKSTDSTEAWGEHH